MHSRIKRYFGALIKEIPTHWTGGDFFVFGYPNSIALYTQLLKNLQEQQELADLEEASSYDPTKSKSWEKMKAQRRAAEKRKASLSRSADSNIEGNNEDEIRFL